MSILPANAYMFAALDQRDTAIRERDAARRELADIKLDAKLLAIARDQLFAGVIALSQVLHVGPVFAAARDYAMHGPSDIWGPLEPHDDSVASFMMQWTQLEARTTAKPAAGIGRQWQDGARRDVLP